MKYILIAILALCMGCAGKKDTRPPIVFAPTNPDLPAVVEPIKSAKTSAGKASASLDKILGISQQLPSSISVEQIRLELATTKEHLRIVGEQLDLALLRAQTLDKQIGDVKAWGIAQNALYVAEYDRAEANHQKADKANARALQSGRERDILVWCISLSITLIVVTATRPILMSIPNPLMQGLAFAGIAAGTIGASFLAARLILAFLARLTL